MKINIILLKEKLLAAFSTKASKIELASALAAESAARLNGLSKKADLVDLEQKASTADLLLKADTGLSNITSAGEQKIKDVMTQPLASKSNVLTEYFSQESSVDAGASQTTTGITTTVPAGVYIIMSRQVGQSPSTLALGIQVDGTYVNSNVASSAASSPNVQAQCVHILIATATSTRVNTWYSSSVAFTGKRHVLTIYKLS